MMKYKINNYLTCLAVLILATMTSQAFAAQACSNNSQRYTNVLSSDRAYRVNANLFNVPNARLCVDHSYEGSKKAFTVRNKGVSIPVGGAPMGYPNIYKGCHYGACTNGFTRGRLVRDIRGATSTWKIAGTSTGGIWNAAYDIWFNKQRDAPRNANPNGLELMIWIHRKGSINPAGSRSGSLEVQGKRYEVWVGNVPAQTSKVVTYRATSNTRSVTNLNLKAFMDDAKRRGLLSNNWYLTSIQAGFEVWSGGTGLRNDYFSASTR